MNNELICTPVMLPTDNIIEQPGLRKSRKMGIISIGTLQGSLGNIWQSQHLYLVSEVIPKQGDYIIVDKVIIFLEQVAVPFIDKKSVVVAATDKSLSLPLIPTSFIEEYVLKQGEIDKVRVKLTSVGTPAIKVYHSDNNDILDPGVIILPIEDKTFSREEVEDILVMFKLHLNKVGLEQPGIIEWFDLNY